MSVYKFKRYFPRIRNKYPYMESKLDYKTEGEQEFYSREEVDKILQEIDQLTVRVNKLVNELLKS